MVLITGEPTNLTCGAVIMFGKFKSYLLFTMKIMVSCQTATNDQANGK